MADPRHRPPQLSPQQRELERRLFHEAVAARAAATQADIEATGIIPNTEEIVESLSRPLEQAPEESSTLVRHGAAQKVYKRATFADFDEDYKHRYPPQKDTNDSDEEFEKEWTAAFAGLRAEEFDPALLDQYRRRARTDSHKLKAAANKLDLLRRNEKEPVAMQKFDLIGSLSSCRELAVEVCKHLPARDIVKLYSISLDFHDIIDAYMRSSVTAWARYKAPEAGLLFKGGVYKEMYSIPDPAGRYRDKNAHDMSYITHPERRRGLVRDTAVRDVLGLRWLQLVCQREVRVRDIVATLARHGHRLPPDTSMTLKKLWLIMDIPTSEARAATISNERFFSDEDLVRAQMFFTKLDMLFNDPIIGPGSSSLTWLMLGQKSLSTLWAFLRRKAYTTIEDIQRLKIRYDVGPSEAVISVGELVLGLHLYEMGTVHLEGWGTGDMHLLRPDELVPMEAARRGLEIDHFARQLMMYGHVNINLGAPLVPSLDEMYMSDDELPEIDTHVSPVNRGCGNVPFERRMWQPKHARKASWGTLAREEKEMIIAEEKREIDQEWSMDFAEARYHEAIEALTKSIQPFLHVCREISDRKHCLSDMGDYGEPEPVKEGIYNGDGDDGDDDDGDAQMAGASPVPPEPDNNEARTANPEITAIVDRLAAEQIYPSSQAEHGDNEEVDVDEDDEKFNSDEAEYEDEDEDEENEDKENHNDFWEASHINPDDFSSPMTHPTSDNVTSLDEDLLAQADEDYDEEDLNFDWEEHIRDIRKTNGSPSKEAIEDAKARGQYTLPVVLPSDRVPPPVDSEDNEEGEEDEREEFIRDYYRNWVGSGRLQINFRKPIAFLIWRLPE
ncbi:hypothetical protein B0T16DRAFT_387258 [Cercophora newfieldiana]|uniref:Uncharacterized protein n=1 Tax=Cercophora newfieldiana TaxID=92897 RepID=A0AA40CUI1_9PEZI|nr:hypothetical protein B0T16DRAFT_387258 [Cercophora newfieldiana]